MGKAPSWSDETVLSGDAISASRARDFVCFRLVEHALLYLVEDMRLVVSELVTNAIEHARTPLLVRIEQESQVVLLTVQDRSLDLPHERFPEVQNAGGRGLFIVDLLSRDWGVTVGPGRQKSVWATFAAPR
jgi:anti-sigma regulatory factor (Ser/Thr protein kinase)